MNKLKESILNYAKKNADDTINLSNDPTGAITTTATSATGATVRASDTYIHGIGIVSFLPADSQVFFVSNKRCSQTGNKEQVKEK